jgi:hypothetical protein
VVPFVRLIPEMKLLRLNDSELFALRTIVMQWEELVSDPTRYERELDTLMAKLKLYDRETEYGLL